MADLIVITKPVPSIGLGHCRARLLPFLRARNPTFLNTLTYYIDHLLSLQKRYYYRTGIIQSTRVTIPPSISTLVRVKRDTQQV